jgi:putative two-component system response regulator
MPDMDGYSVCRQLKANPDSENIPVIFVSGLASVHDETAGFAAGAVDYLSKPVSPPIVKARVRTHLSLTSAKKLEQSYREAIYMLGMASEFRDTDTGTHIWRMSAYSGALATAIGWNADSSRNLEMAATMHDLGKLAIPDSILLKPGKLNAEEWQIMRTHTTTGYNILSQGSAEIVRMAASVALHHHERWDGGGYPHGLVGEAIPEVARIVSIADVFDALSMTRPYKESWPTDRVIANLAENAGTQFDPRLIEHFMRILPRILEIKSYWDARADQEQSATLVNRLN